MGSVRTNASDGNTSNAIELLSRAPGDASKANQAKQAAQGAGGRKLQQVKTNERTKLFAGSPRLQLLTAA